MQANAIHHGPRDILLGLFRYRRRAILFFFVVMVAVSTATFSLRPVYESSTDILVRIGRESISVDPDVANSVNPVLNIGNPLKSEVSSEIAILKSAAVLADATRRIGEERILAHGKPFQVELLNTGLEMLAVWRDKASSLLSNKAGGEKTGGDHLKTAFEILQSNMHVQTIESGNVISISYQGHSPQDVRDTLAAIVASYQDRRLEVLRQENSMPFFSRQTEDLLVQINENEQKLSALLQKVGTTSITEQKTILANRIQEISSQIDTVESDLKASEAMVWSLKTRIASLPERVVLEERSGIGNSPVEAMRERLFELKVREQDMLGKFKETSYPLVTLRREIEELQAVITREEGTRREKSVGINEVRQVFTREMLAQSAQSDSLRASLSVLRRQKEHMSGEIERFLKAEAQIGMLERELGLQRANYAKYASLAEQARINQALHGASISNVSILQAPSIPFRPAGFSKGLNLALGLGFGLIGGITLAFISDLLDTRVKTPEEATLLVGGSHAVSIPYQKKRHRPLAENSSLSLQSQLLEQTRLVAGSLAPIQETTMEEAGGATYVPASVPPGRVILVTGSRPGDGATHTTRLLAAIFSLSFGRVLVVDANVTDPVLHTAVGAPLEPGLTSLVLDEASSRQVIVHTASRDIDFIPAGQLKNGSALQYYAKANTPGRMEDIFRELRHKYPFIIVDGPALSNGSPGAYLAGAADMAFVVIAEGDSRRDVVRFAMDRLRRANPGLPVQAVFNKRRMHIPGWLYNSL